MIGFDLFAQELGSLPWCPVLADAPAEGLPWPARHERVAPPHAIRPFQDVWLCSGTMRILAADNRSTAPFPVLFCSIILL